MKNADVYQFYLFSMALLMALSMAFMLFVVFHKHKQAENNLRLQETVFNHRNALMQSRLEVQEQSMTLVADELHDNLGHMLTLARQYLDLAYNRLDAGPVRDLLGYSRDIQDALTARIRNISHSLANDLLRELGLLRSAERLLESLEPLGIKTDFETSGTPVSLETEKDLLIFRIIQEFIQNTLKHAQALRFSLAFHFRPGMLEIAISDDGKGFDPGLLESGGHLGLLSIRNRISLLRGEIQMETAEGKGSKFNISIPLVSV